MDGAGRMTLFAPPVLSPGAPAAAVTGRRSAIGLLRILLIGSVLVPVVMLATAACLSYRAAVQDARHDLERASQVAQEHAAKLFEEQEQLADRVNDLVRGLSDADVRARELALHRAVVMMSARFAQVKSVAVISRTGQPLVSATAYPVPATLDLSNRDYVRAILGGYTGTYISALQPGGLTGKDFFGFARPWHDDQGTIRGVIDTVISPDFFRDFYAALIKEEEDSASGEVLTLVRADGNILVTYPALPPNRPDLAQISQSFMQAIALAPDRGVYEGRSLARPGHPRRLFAYWKVGDYPLYVVAGRSYSIIMDDWMSDAESYLYFGVPATLVMVALAWTALVRTRREEEALALANSEFQRRQAAEDALLRAQRLEAVGQMTGGVAHDFNNLLTIISGSVELLEKRPEQTERVLRLAGNIRLAARRGAEITQKLLTFSMRQIVKPEVIDLNNQLREFRPLLERAASEAVRVEFHLDPTLRRVRLDPGHFEAAILNLVGNARDAMPDGGRIDIRTRNTVLSASVAGELAPGDYVAISVSDTGTGMDPQTAAHAFEPFFTTKDVGKGTGLGLSQVYGFVRQAGGDIRITTTLGRGTTMSLLLPRVTDAQIAAERPPVDTLIQTGRENEVVLVVEDEPDVRDIAVEGLTDLGYAVLTAADGRAALDVLKREDRVDVLFSDIVMPGGISGLQLAMEARRMRPELRILLTSGYATVVGDEFPADITLLSKPYTRLQLGSHLRRVLEGRAAA